LADANGFFGLAKAKLSGPGSWNVTTSVLAAGSSLGEDWVLAEGAINWDNGNFQSLQLKPYYQKADAGSQSVQEGGASLNYRLNLAGVLDSHFRVGQSAATFDNAGLQSSSTRGFVQNGEFLDVLGIFTMDAAFRLDYSSVSPSVFSTLIGVQANEDIFTFFGDYGNGESVSRGGLNQEDAGLSCFVGGNLELIANYFHEGVPGDVRDGGRFRLEWEDSTFLGFFRRLRLEGDVRVSAGNGGQCLTDWGGAVRLNFTKEGGAFFKGRAFSGGAFYGQAGLFYSAVDFLRVFANLENVSGQPVSWPDPDLPLGRVFLGGVDFIF
jgi:hypothetical protein